MAKTNLKIISAFILLFFMSNNLKALDDSDVFLSAVFFTAIKKSNYEKALRMIEKGIVLNEKDSSGLTPLAYSLKNDDEKMFNLLIDRGGDINKEILDGTSHLIFYISNKRYNLIKHILKSGADIDFQDKLGRTALMNAIERSNFNAVNILISKDFDQDITDYSGKDIISYLRSSKDTRIKNLINRLNPVN
mgnify:FL=1